MRLNSNKDNELDEQYGAIVNTIRDSVQIALEEMQAPSKITKETGQLLKKRQELKQAGQMNVEYAELCKLIQKRLMVDLNNWQLSIVRSAIENNRGLHKVCQQLLTGTHSMIAVQLADGCVKHYHQLLLKEVKQFYNNLYSSIIPVSTSQKSSDEEPIAPFLDCEVRKALLSMRHGTTPGEDGVMADALKLASHTLVQPLCKLSNNCISSNRIPTGFANSNTILLFKKGDPNLVANYRPISLLSTIYKTFTRVLTNRLESYLEDPQPVEQAGFRRGFSTADHIQTLNELAEKCDEFHLPLFMLFIDFEKAYDSIEYGALYEALRRQSIPEQAIRLLQTIYENGCTTIHVRFDKMEINVCRGVRQGDTISPKLFSACLQLAFVRVNWQGKGININGQHLNHLRFANDIVLILHNYNQLQKMAKDLQRQAKATGLKINVNKSKLVTNQSTDQRPSFIVAGQQVEQVSEFVYLGQMIGDSTKRQKEIGRRVTARLRSYFKYKMIYTSKRTPIFLKRRLFNSCVLPTMLYGAKTWSLTKREENWLAVAQR
uniref:Reverse transcriptase domain-containing protein n=1 Tax=Plectus sambesii TaxID=2011161 RepID=A0A914VZY2_9BILA